MKGFNYRIAAFGFAATIFTIASCNDRNTAAGVGEAGSGTDTNLVDSRRNSTDTVNYLTKDSGNQSGDVVDPNRPATKD